MYLGRLFLGTFKKEEENYLGATVVIISGFAYRHPFQSAAPRQQVEEGILDRYFFFPCRYTRVVDN